MKTREEAKEAILRLADKKEGRPFLVGEASLMLGSWSLRETEALIEEMVGEGLIREATKDESWHFDCPFGYLRCKTHL